ncbi:MAG: hypothetical protein WC708_06205 [Lentisphaeria bacterium]
MHGFEVAQYIWLDDGIPERPSAILLKTALAATSCRIRITAGNLYRLFVNGEMVAYGPARAPHGYARIDNVDLTSFLKLSKNEVVIEAVNYAVKNFYLPLGPAFVRAEIIGTSGECLKATGRDNDFTACTCSWRNWNVGKSTPARALMESYNYNAFPSGELTRKLFGQPAPISVKTIKLHLLERHAPMPDMKICDKPHLVHTGFLQPAERPRQLVQNFLKQAPKIRECMMLPEGSPMNLEERLASYNWGLGGNPDEKGYWLFDFGRASTGFIKLFIVCHRDAEIIIGHDEIMLEPVFTGKRKWWANDCIQIYLKAGQRIDFESIEPYIFRYLAIFKLSGAIEILAADIREYAFPKKQLINSVHNGNIPRKLLPIYHAAVETFRQNTVDTFMDCPGRERAGYPCDGFFTARAAYFLTGETSVEEAFMENFLSPSHFDGLPDGMLPMCYPADIDNFIPQWPMWLLLQLNEYLMIRHGRRQFQNEFKDRILKFIKYFAPYINRDGLLENLPGWNFIEWSKANDYVNGVHFPTNLLFAACLKIVSAWYEQPEYEKQARQIQDTACRLAYDGYCLHDHAVRESDGTLKIRADASEIAQYFALFFNLLPPGSTERNNLETMLFTRQHRSCTEAPVAMFIGRLLRLELLRMADRYEQLTDEIDQSFSRMALLTGTLWENDTPDASCCHGFASYVAPLLAEAVSCRRDNKQTTSQMAMAR